MERIKSKDVVLVTSDEKALGYKWEDKASELNNIEVVSEDYGLPKLIADVQLIGYRPGNEQVFVKNPMQHNQFIEVSKAEDLIYRNKIKLYKNIARILGAQSFNAKAEFVEMKKLSINANAEMNIKAVNIKADLKKEHTERFNKTYELNSVFELDENFDRKKAYIDALDIIRKYNLQHEVEIVGLIENNNPDDQSREQRQTVRFELSSELNDLLEASFKINALSGIFALDANFKSTTETLRKIVLETEIVF